MKKYKLIKLYPIAGFDSKIINEAFLSPCGFVVHFDSREGKYYYNHGFHKTIKFSKEEIESYPKFWEILPSKDKADLTYHQKAILALFLGGAIGLCIAHSSGIGKVGYVERLKIEARLLEIQAELKKLLLQGKGFPVELISERADLLMKLQTITSGKTEKPPLGIMPKRLHDEIRLDDISKAVDRCLSAKKNVPAEWLIEKKQLEKSLNEKN